MSETYYIIATYTQAQFEEVHNELCGTDISPDTIPDRAVECTDHKEHSAVRGEFLLTEDEATILQTDDRIKLINESPNRYPEKFMPPSDEFKADVWGEKKDRWNSPYNNYQAWTNEFSSITSNFSNAEPTVNRTTALYRMQTKQNPWKTSATDEYNAISAKVQQQGAGEHVDVICADNGTWIAHTEFINKGVNNAVNPIDYKPGNVLNRSGYCDVLDVVLDGPYYIDPDWFNPDPEYNNGAVGDVLTGDGSDFFKREVTTNGVRIMGAGGVGGQVAVPDAWLEKVARMFELFLDPAGTGINESLQRTVIQTLSGDPETYHAGFPTLQRVARGAGADYSPNFLTDQGTIDWNLTGLYDTHVQNDMVWYLNSTGSGYGDGDLDAQEVIEHVFHTLHMHGLPAEDIKLYPYISSDWDTSDLYAAMEEAYDAGKWDPSGYNNPADDWKTNGDAFEVAAKEYLYLLNFCMFEYTSLWDGGSLSPEWTDDMRTQSGIQTNNPLGYAFHNTWIAPVISKPSLATIRSIFQDGNTPVQDDPTLAGASGYVADPVRLETRWDGTIVPTETAAHNWWRDSTQRSASFQGFGNILVSTGYTRDNVHGSPSVLAYDADHGTQCASLIYGRTHGWAYNCNKWHLNLYGTGYNVGSIEIGFDVQKIFHTYKPINPVFGTRDPTISSNSWGYRASNKSGSYYYFRNDGATSYGGYLNEPNFISYLGSQGDGGRWKSEMYDNSLTQAGDELTEAGVIFVCAAGNSNQPQYNPDHPNYDNRISNNNTNTFYQDTFTEFGFSVTGSTNRRGFPQHIGKTESQTFQGNTTVKFPAINVGCLNDAMTNSYDQDRKVDYSDCGNAIDFFAPGDGTLAACPNGTYGVDTERSDDTYPDLTILSGCRDTRFSGTSAACPVGAGYMAVVMQYNRSWTYEELRNWIQTSVEEQPSSDMYEGTEVTTSGGNWSGDYDALQGADRRVLYAATIPINTPYPADFKMEGPLTLSSGSFAKVV